MPGRPKKKRIKSVCECGSSTRVSKAGSQGNYSNCKKPEHNKSSCKEPILKQTPKPKGGPGRPKKNQSFVNLEDADVGVRGPVRDEGASRSRKGVDGSQQGSEVKGGFKGGAGGSKQASAVAGGSKGGAGAGGSKKVVLVGLNRVVQTQDEDQVEQTQEQAEIDLTQVEQTQEKNSGPSAAQEEPQQVTLRRQSERILQRSWENKAVVKTLPSM
ncbi:hypothetical protein Tco_1252796 [Tanacetum coccineum]